jgi:hypothetical protein
MLASEKKIKPTKDHPNIKNLQNISEVVRMQKKHKDAAAYPPWRHLFVHPLLRIC